MWCRGSGFVRSCIAWPHELGLAGHVGNDTDGVFVEVEGARADVGLLPASPGAARRRPLARVFDGSRRPRSTHHGRAPVPDRRKPERRARGGPLCRPDVAVCDDCLAELFDPDDRRYRYPFINCTNCGPRFTITVRLPYDRPNTTMPASRSAPLAPTSITTRGPALPRPAGGVRRVRSAWSGSSTARPQFCGRQRWHRRFEADAAIAATQAALAAGQIVAVKGLGGYHLACDATSATAVARLRRRKASGRQAVCRDGRRRGRRPRPGRDQPAGIGCCWPDQPRPIVLLRRRAASPITDQVSPGNPYVGVLLPYTPLHHLLFRAVPGSQVRGTRGPGDDQRESERRAHLLRRRRRPARLRRFVDAWLVHDRPIHVPCDDSVVRVERGQELPIRRSRGYAPLPVRLPFDAVPLLAAGGELKNTFCLASGRDAWMSQHIGDMGSVETLAAFERSAAQFADMYQVGPEQWPPTATPATRPAGGPRTTPDWRRGAGAAPPRPHRLRYGRTRRAR